MTVRLFLQAVTKFLSVLIIVALLIFLPAGKLFVNGLIFIGVLFVPMFAAGIVMMVRSPELLRKRLDAKEKEDEQRIVIVCSVVMFIAAFTAAGISYRFGFLVLPMPVSVAAAVIFLAAYLLYAEVMRENAYLSRKVEVQEGQKVIDTGMYGVVRHPMYSVTVILFLMMPLILGSVISFIIMLAYIPLIVMRIRNEEEILGKELDGYSEYMKKVKYRLFPHIW